MQLRRYLCVLMMGATAAAASACGSQDPEPAAAPSQWPATDQVRSLLHVNTWQIANAGDHAELTGIGDPTTPGAKAAIRVRAKIAPVGDDGYVFDFDLPQPWRLEVVPGQPPNTSGPLPSSVAYALASSVLDAPAVPHASAGSLTTSGMVFPRTGLLSDSACLIVTGQNLLQKADTASYVPLGTGAATLAKGLQACQNVSVPMGAQSCRLRLLAEASRCDTASVQDAQQLQQDAQARLANADPNDPHDMAAAQQGVNDFTNNPNATQLGMCVTFEQILCDYTHSQELEVKRCLNQANCKALPNSTWYSGPADSCIGSFPTC